MKLFCLLLQVLKKIIWDDPSRHGGCKYIFLWIKLIQVSTYDKNMYITLDECCVFIISFHVPLHQHYYFQPLISNPSMIHNQYKVSRVETLFPNMNIKVKSFFHTTNFGVLSPHLGLTSNKNLHENQNQNPQNH